MAAIPVFKIAILAVKQIAKPIANVLKQSAHTNPCLLLFYYYYYATYIYI